MLSRLRGPLFGLGRRVSAVGSGFVDTFLRDNKVVPVVLALLALLVFAWIVAGAIIGGPDEEQGSNRAEVAQTRDPVFADPPAPEVENRDADSYAAYQFKDPFRQLVAPAETTTATTPTTTPTTEPGEPDTTVAITNSLGERVPVHVEIADTPDEQTRGLMGRTELAEDAGMLFVFDREVQLPFTMENTLIPLSIAFIDTQGRIVDILDMQPLDETTPYSSAEPYRYALEVNQGFFEARGIEVGNVLE